MKLGIRRFLVHVRQIMAIEEIIDVKNTVSSIKRDIEFKGPALWILIFSIFIASIGLNTNSPAVIIGAMLISPLMGPILGVGLSLGINDTETLNRSLRNLATMVVLSLLASTLYFAISPLSDAQSELLARTRPTLLDVFVAFFGGAAGIVAGARKEKSNVIPGVAIATALMPPLCTAGYGLATAQFSYFFGALYLFVINSIFICVATFLGVRYLNFPLVEFVDPIRAKKAKRYVISAVVLIVLPSTFIFIKVIQESLWYRNANLFVEEHVAFGDNVISNKVYNYEDQPRSILVFMDGGKTIPEEVIDEWRGKMEEQGLSDTELKIVQSGGDLDEYIALMEQFKSETFKELYVNNEEQLRKREARIADLEAQLNAIQGDSIPLGQILREVQVQVPAVRRLAWARSIELTNAAAETDTVMVFFVDWKGTTESEVQKAHEEQLQRYLSVRLNLDSVRVRPF
jgi:uncharacterized hydrophobic protein (TIGR00271 family)